MSKSDEAEKTSAPKVPGQVSGTLWLLPIFLSLLGGIIAWYISKDQDPRKAKQFLYLGLILFFLPIIIGAVFFVAFAGLFFL